ncbi:MAG: hypothetical protein M5U28_49550 [Sandaracinaceae bacterium]|nr:hypothetical protein [Sandaracinaceae bacterium]
MRRAARGHRGRSEDDRRGAGPAHVRPRRRELAARDDGHRDPEERRRDPRSTPLASVASAALKASPTSQAAVTARRRSSEARRRAGAKTAALAHRNTAAEAAKPGAAPSIWRAFSKKSGVVAAARAAHAPARRPAKRETRRNASATAASPARAMGRRPRPLVHAEDREAARDQPGRQRRPLERGVLPRRDLPREVRGRELPWVPDAERRQPCEDEAARHDEDDGGYDPPGSSVPVHENGAGA